MHPLQDQRGGGTVTAITNACQILLVLQGDHLNKRIHTVLKNKRLLPQSFDINGMI